MLIGREKLAGDFKKLCEGGGLANGYIFFGPPRTGKKLFASYLANFLETGKFDEPKTLGDFLLVEPDKEGTIGIEQSRALKNFLWQKPFVSARRTAVIDTAEAMTGEAQNAILKIAEEPPESALIIIVADDPERLWPTLVSRFHKVYFQPVSGALIEKWLVAEKACGATEAKKIAAACYGQPGLALMMASDKNFGALMESAARLVKSGFWERRNMIKSMLEDESFDISSFLEAVMMNISSSAPGNRELWHKVSALRRESESYNINPRLQLEALLGA